MLTATMPIPYYFQVSSEGKADVIIFLYNQTVLTTKIYEWFPKIS